MSRRADGGSTVDGDAVVLPFVRDRRLAGVDPHAHPGLRLIAPVVLGQGALGRDSAVDRLPGAAEHGEERIPSLPNTCPPADEKASRRSRAGSSSHTA